MTKMLMAEPGPPPSTGSGKSSSAPPSGKVGGSKPPLAPRNVEVEMLNDSVRDLLKRFSAFEQRLDRIEVLLLKLAGEMPETAPEDDL